MTPHKFRSFYGRNPDRQMSGSYITFPITFQQFYSKPGHWIEELWQRDPLECTQFLWPSIGDLAFFFWIKRLWLYWESEWELSKILSTMLWCWWLRMSKCTLRIQNIPALISANTSHCWCWCWTRRMRGWTTEGSNDSLPPVERPRQQLTSSHKTEL